MSKSMIAGTVLGIGIATAGGAISGYKMLKEPDHAEVIKTVARLFIGAQEPHDRIVQARLGDVEDWNRNALPRARPAV